MQLFIEMTDDQSENLTGGGAPFAPIAPTANLGKVRASDPNYDFAPPPQFNGSGLATANRAKDSTGFHDF